MAARYESLFLISRFQAELDRLFQEAAQIGDGDTPLGEWQPAIDVVETPAVVQILAEVPGFAAADLKVEVRGTRVVISGTKSTTLPDGPGGSASTAWSADTAASPARSTSCRPSTLTKGPRRCGTAC